MSIKNLEISKIHIFIGFFLVVDIILVVLHYFFGELMFFNLDSEHNLPTLYQATKTAFVACLATTYFIFTAYIFSPQAKKKETFSMFIWFVFVVGFLYLAIDEAGEIHEHVPVMMEQLFPVFTSNYFGFFSSLGYQANAWVLYYIPAFVGALVFFPIAALHFWKEFKSLSLLLVLGAVIIIIVPITEAVATNTAGVDTDSYQKIMMLEEGAEMVGITVFLAFVITALRRKILSYKEIK